MVLLKRLGNEDACRYAALTFKYLVPRLERLDEEDHTIAFGLEMEEGSLKYPAGLIVVQRNLEQNMAEVISLFVAKSYRQLGLGTALIRRMESYLQETDCIRMRVTYYAGKMITPVLESFLHSNGWSPSFVEGKVYKADKRISDAPWLKKIGLPASMSAHFWSEISDTEKSKLRSLENVLYPSFLSPFKTEHVMEKSNSLVLKVKGEIMGWCITYRIAEDTILYDSVFVVPEYHLSGCAFMLMSRTILLQLDQDIPYAMFAVNTDTLSMGKIVDRWLTPYIFHVSEKRASYKSCGPRSDDDVEQ
jgi:GNAT superfamily N-acetyltransferase